MGILNQYTFLPATMYQLLALTQASPILTFAAMGFWVLMLVDCVRHEPDRQIWLWLIIFLSVPGSIIYFVVRVLPRQNVPLPSFFKRWTMKQKLWNAEAGVRNIGKAHQHITLANLLVELSDGSQAQVHFQKALELEPQNTDALWGLSLIAIQTKQLEAAKGYLQSLLQKDPSTRYGDASLQYGKVLFDLQEWEAASAHLKRDIREWSHPEASWLLAQIQVRQGALQEAREVLDQMLYKVKASPAFHYRRHRSLIGKAERMLRGLS
jgi:hypothetical protein